MSTTPLPNSTMAQDKIDPPQLYSDYQHPDTGNQFGWHHNESDVTRWVRGALAYAVIGASTLLSRGCPVSGAERLPYNNVVRSEHDVAELNHVYYTVDTEDGEAVSETIYLIIRDFNEKTGFHEVTDFRAVDCGYKAVHDKRGRIIRYVAVPDDGGKGANAIPVKDGGVFKSVWRDPEQDPLDCYPFDRSPKIRFTKFGSVYHTYGEQDQEFCERESLPHDRRKKLPPR
jgi:hypothetical protein